MYFVTVEFYKRKLFSELLYFFSYSNSQLYWWFRKDAAVNMEGQFLVRQIYEDEITYNLISAAVNKLSTYSIQSEISPSRGLTCNRKFYWTSCALDIPANEILELFGRMFFEFCQDSGYDKILQVLGATPRDFLQVNLENCPHISYRFLLYE